MGTVPQGQGGGFTARGVLSTTFLGVQMWYPGATSWAVQGQLQHTEILSCTTGDGFYSPTSLASVWLQAGQTGFSQACSLHISM